MVQISSYPVTAPIRPISSQRPGSDRGKGYSNDLILAVQGASDGRGYSSHARGGRSGGHAHRGGAMAGRAERVI